MSLYSQYIFPIFLDYMMSQPMLRPLRRELLSEVQGDVLEIGFGTGVNLPFYPPHISGITAVDANAGTSRKARVRIRSTRIEVKHHTLNAERLPFPDGAFDSVVSAFTLCSIADVDKALSEIRRVLKPAGRFFFLEHGLSDDPAVQKWQHRLTPINRVVGDGCHLNRDMKGRIEQAHFSLPKLDRFYLPQTPRVLGYLYRGMGEKSS